MRQVWAFSRQFMKNRMCDQLDRQLDVSQGGTESNRYECQQGFQ